VRKLTILLLALALAPAFACAAPDTVAVMGPMPGPRTEIGQVTTLKKARYCGQIGFVDLGSATDGPSYYFQRKSGKIISVCGGACWFTTAAQREICRTKCPPKEWTCGR
jgi:hypothetical protein